MSLGSRRSMVRPFEKPHGRLPRRPSVPSPSRNHHDRLDLPLFPSIKLRTGSEVVEGYAPFKTFQINGRSKFKVQREALLRSDRGWQLGFAETIKGELDSKAMHLKSSSLRKRMCYAKRARSMASNPLSSGMKASKIRGHRRVRPSYQGPSISSVLLSRSAVS